MSVSIIDGLTRDHLKALRKASGVIFQAQAGRDRAYGSIQCIGEDDARLTMDCVASLRQASFPGATRRRPSQGWEYIQSALFHEEWVTTARLLKPNDKLALVFEADLHSSEIVLAADLHADVLRLQVDRGKERLWFGIAQRVCLDNSARMVR